MNTDAIPHFSSHIFKAGTSWEPPSRAAVPQVVPHSSVDGPALWRAHLVCPQRRAKSTITTADDDGALHNQLLDCGFQMLGLAADQPLSGLVFGEDDLID
jgi:hypothetical protein